MAAPRELRPGSYTVWLNQPLDGGKISHIDFEPIRMDHLIRWASGDIRSTLDLMAAITGVPEPTLRTLSYPDVDRVMLIFQYLLPEVIRDSLGKGERPLATPEAKMSAEEQYAAVDRPAEDDPRFPHFEGIREVLPPAGSEGGEGSEDQDDGPGLDMAAPDAVRKVG